MTKAFHKMTHYFVYQKGSLHKIENNNIPNKCKKGKIKYVFIKFGLLCANKKININEN